VGLAVTVMGFVSALYTFQSKVSINPGDRLDPGDPFRTPFIVRNGGVLPIFDVEGYCGMVLVEWSEPFVRFEHGMMKRKVARISELWPGDGLLLRECFRAIVGPPPNIADMVFGITYRPVPFVRWRRDKSERYELHKGKDGFYWVPRALEGPPNREPGRN
jgi:hypothetical protein